MRNKLFCVIFVLGSYGCTTMSAMNVPGDTSASLKLKSDIVILWRMQLLTLATIYLKLGLVGHFGEWLLGNRLSAMQVKYAWVEG